MMYNIVKTIKSPKCTRDHCETDTIMAGPFTDINKAYRQCAVDNNAYNDYNCGCITAVAEVK